MIATVWGSLLLLLFHGFATGLDTRDLLGRLGSKTPYAERVIHEQHAEPETCFHTEADCKPIHIYKVVRHGTRYPTEKHIKKMRKVAALFGREVPFRDFDAGLLTELGQLELLQMGQRTRERHAELFQYPYHPLRYDFKSSQVTRALQSAEAFARGLFNQSNVAISSETKEMDRLLRFHKACPNYATQVKKNSTHKESGHGSKMEKKVQEEVFRAIEGRIEDAQLRAELRKANKRINVVAVIWDMCMMEHASLNRTSYFCSLLSEKDLDLLEYVDDVHMFWNKAYGFAINYEMSCLLFKDMVDTIMSAFDAYVSTDGTDEEVEGERRFGTFRFAHAETLIPLIARFGLFQDEKGHEPYLSHKSVDSPDVQSRTWRGGAVVPFAANVAIVLHSCSNDHEMMIQVLHNEHPVHLPETLCPKHEQKYLSLCSLEPFVRAISETMECDFEEICHGKPKERE